MTFKDVDLAIDIQWNFEGIATDSGLARTLSKTAGAVCGRFDDGQGCSLGKGIAVGSETAA
jgi:hypothetical protein